VNLWISGAIIVGAIAVAVTLMSLARRRAPVGGFFTDLDRAAGVFGVLGTSFAVLLAFVIFVAFESYVNAKDKAGQEAVSVSELYHTAQLFPSPTRAELAGQTICYARSVIDDEWPKMREQRRSTLAQGWTAQLDATAEHRDLAGKEAVAFGHWLDQSAARREGRRGRLAEAKPFVPQPLWLVLILGAGLLVGFMCFFADRSEAFLVQAMMIGAITAVVVSGLLVIRFLDRPYENRSGSIQPAEMRQTLELIEQERKQPDHEVRPPCDAHGRPLSQS
jgi:amino acid transporter